MKICIACSAGGHLTELLELKEFYSKHEHFFLTFERINSKNLAKEEKVYFVTDPKRNPLKLLLNFLQSLKVFLREKPDAIISNGAGVAAPTAYIAKLFGKKIIFIESFCRVKTPSFSGKVFHPIADLFLVQWPEIEGKYKKAKFVGAVV